LNRKIAEANTAGHLALLRGEDTEAVEHFTLANELMDTCYDLFISDDEYAADLVAADEATFHVDDDEYRTFHVDDDEYRIKITEPNVYEYAIRAEAHERYLLEREVPYGYWTQIATLTDLFSAERVLSHLPHS
jgi:hypothetical protein